VFEEKIVAFGPANQPSNMSLDTFLSQWETGRGMGLKI